MDSYFENKIRRLEDDVLLKRTNFDEKKKEIDRINAQIQTLLKEIDLDVDSINFIEKVATENRLSVKQKVESLINKALHHVYGEEYGIEFEYGISSNKTAVEVKIIKNLKDGKVVKREFSGNGLGVADLVSFPLKLMVLLSSGDDIDAILVADEPGKHMDEDRAENFAKFLNLICVELNIQMIVCSHWSVMKEYAHNIINVHFNGTKSIATAEKEYIDNDKNF